MKIIRLYTDTDNELHCEDIEAELNNAGKISKLSEKVNATVRRFSTGDILLAEGITRTRT